MLYHCVHSTWALTSCKIIIEASQGEGIIYIWVWCCLLTNLMATFVGPFRLELFLCLGLPWLLTIITKCSVSETDLFSTVAQMCLTLCDPRNCSTPGLLIHHQWPESTQTHVHWVSDAIQSSHPLSSPFPPALNLSQHQGLFQWVNSSYQVAKYWSFSFNISPSNEHPELISFRMDWLDLLAVQGTLRVLSNTTVQKHQVFGAQLSLESNSHIHT